MRRGTSARLVLGIVLVPSLAFGTTGCRKKASAKDCDQLLDRFAELVVRERFADAGADMVASERARERKEAQGDDAFKNCTSEVQADELTCAMKAETSDKLIKCLE
jgi:hypothetical protein